MRAPQIPAKVVRPFCIYYSTTLPKMSVGQETIGQPFKPNSVRKNPDAAGFPAA